MTAEQAELIDKLNCLEFETSQLNQAYQLWRSNVEQGTVPDWMAAAIRVTYDALMMLSEDNVTISGPMEGTQGSDAEEIESDDRRGEGPYPPRRALTAQDNITALSLRNGQPFQYEHAQTDPPVHFPALLDGSLALTPVSQQNRIVGMLALADVPPAFSARPVAELEASAYEVPCILEEESTTAEPHAEILPMTEPDWSEAEMPVAISPLAADDETSAQPSIQHDQQEECAEPPAVAIESLATLRLPSWLEGSTSKLFGAISLSILAFVAILMVIGGVLGIYLASPHRATLRSAVEASENSTTPTEAGIGAIPTGAKAEFKFDPDPMVAALGSSFVVNAVLSRGSDIASVGVEIDYDANLLQFVGASEGGFLAKAGQNFVLAQRNDPVTGVLKINAEQAPGSRGISGDGPVFALAFQAKKKGNATVSIIPGAHDSQGRRIDVTGSQVSVRVN